MFHFLQIIISFPVERNRKGSVGKRQDKKQAETPLQSTRREERGKQHIDFELTTTNNFSQISSGLFFQQNLEEIHDTDQNYFFYQ
jgi:hypothetical protein